jgi:hypothetical protein
MINSTDNSINYKTQRDKKSYCTYQSICNSYCHFLLYHSKSHLHHHLPPTGFHLYCFIYIACVEPVYVWLMWGAFPCKVSDSMFILPARGSRQVPDNSIPQKGGADNPWMVYWLPHQEPEAERSCLQVWSLSLYSFEKFGILPCLLHVPNQHLEQALPINSSVIHSPSMHLNIMPLGSLSFLE